MQDNLHLLLSQKLHSHAHEKILKLQIMHQKYN